MLPINCAAIRYALGICPALRPPATPAVLACLALTTADLWILTRYADRPERKVLQCTSHLTYSIHIVPFETFCSSQLYFQIRASICIPLPFVAVSTASRDHLTLINEPLSIAIPFAMAGSSRSQHAGLLLLPR